MSMFARALHPAILLFVFMSLSGPSQATQLQDLLRSDQLRITASLNPAQDIIVGEEVLLTLEISTQRWFAGGTRIPLPEIDGVVITQRDQFAVNLSRTEGDITWVIQRWNLELYAQRAGRFEIPALSVELAVNDADAGIVRGQLSVEPMSLEAQIPPGLPADTRWISAPQLSLEQSLNMGTEDLKPGDAVTRTVTFTAHNLPSMMLPPLAPIQVEGLGVYPELPQLVDRSNRGQAIAERIEETTFVIEQRGRYVLPEQSFYWWNTSTRELSLVSVPAVELIAAPDVILDPAADAVADVSRFSRENWGKVAVISIAMLLLVALYVLTLSRLRRGPRQVSVADINRELKRGDAAAACRKLYQWINQHVSDPNWHELRGVLNTRGVDSAASNALIATAYGAEVDASAASSKDSGQSWRSLHLSTASQRQKVRVWRWLRPIKVELNPGSSAGQQTES